MPRKQTLKVFRTPIGFHDAYVAAPSQKAALEAWGSDHDLFARGVAERIDDPALIREPLDRPGVVIKRLRGTTAEQIAALPKDRPKPPPPKSSAPAAAAPADREPARRTTRTTSPPKPKAKPRPRPDRAPLDQAEQALADARSRHAEQDAALREREADLARERRRLEKDQQAERSRLERERDKARTSYEHAMRAWRG